MDFEESKQAAVARTAAAFAGRSSIVRMHLQIT
jgi:hypothetical protein